MWGSPYHTFFINILIEIKLFQTSVMPPFIKEDDDIPYPKGEPKWPQISPKALYHYFVIRILQQQCLEWFSNKNPRIFSQKLLLLFDHFLVVELCLGSWKIHSTYLMKIFLSKKIQHSYWLHSSYNRRIILSYLLASLFEYLFMFWLHRHLPANQALNSKQRF